jgi:hypothetical protein
VHLPRAASGVPELAVDERVIVDLGEAKVFIGEADEVPCYPGDGAIAAPVHDPSKGGAKMGFFAREVRKPVFIIGPGRSGTTILFDVMATHPDVAWFSKYTSTWPSWPQLAALSRLADVSALERSARDLRAFPRPTESYTILDRCIEGFSSMSVNDGAPSADDADKLRRMVAAHLRWQGKPRFLCKYTGWPRVGFMSSVFPDACFVQIDRDPRAVVASFLKQGWWFRKQPELLQAMSSEDKLRFYSGKYLGYWHARAADPASSKVIQVMYEGFVKDPIATLRGVCERVGLPFTPAFERAITSYEMKRDANDAWRKAFSPAEQARLTELLQEPLEGLGYLDKSPATAARPALQSPAAP